MLTKNTVSLENCEVTSGKFNMPRNNTSGNYAHK